MDVVNTTSQGSEGRTSKSDLTDTAIRNAKPGDKPRKLADKKGLFLLIHPNGSKYWRLKYRYGGKEKMLALGVYPDVGLREARDRRDEARKLLANGVDPGIVKKQSKQSIRESIENSFEAIAREWFAKYSTGWSSEHSEKTIRRLERDIFPWIGGRPIAEITAPELLTVVQRIENRGALETAHRALGSCGKVFRYAISTQRAVRDPSADLRGALPPFKSKHHASITDPKAIGELLRAIQGYKGSFVTRCALQLAPLLFIRPGELRRAEWCDFDLDACEWRIPALKMKMKAVHIVPLSKQSIYILKELHSFTGHGRYLFPSVRTPDRSLSENTVNAALRRLGYEKDQMTGHGFRSMASTILNEQGWNFDAIERQLAHSERNTVRAAYNYAEYLPERRKMMQHWADYLESLQIGASIIPKLLT
ncbi:integrase [Nitrosomonas sp. PY1]|uniref:tyrosine-type recombinase/integrase n=1 Tax=Nitrosomonas sp. PY1 TaxID=1803906 RepID=UPI001FC8E660|nr:integrase arm-type DNA-binding domain-containing protein [Nitrosomonas sp. PY1]GKS69951.1 integrase [Nitrosomonas sp. PY1]